MCVFEVEGAAENWAERVCVYVCVLEVEGAAVNWAEVTEREGRG